MASIPKLLKRFIEGGESERNSAGMKLVKIGAGRVLPEVLKAFALHAREAPHLLALLGSLYETAGKADRATIKDVLTRYTELSANSAAEEILIESARMQLQVIAWIDQEQG